jgi:hypothetical protein
MSTGTITEPGTDTNVEPLVLFMNALAVLPSECVHNTLLRCAMTDIPLRVP